MHIIIIKADGKLSYRSCETSFCHEANTISQHVIMLHCFEVEVKRT